MDQGLTNCRREMKGRGTAKKTSGRHCVTCKYKIRSSGHNEGNHHLSKGAKNGRTD